MSVMVGEHPLNIKKIKIEEHAVKRAIQRFKRKDKSDALNFCKSVLGSSKYIGETTCDRGNKAHMFVSVNNKVQIYLSLDLTKIITVIDSKEKSFIVYDKENVNTEPSENHIFSKMKEIPLQDKLVKLYQTEFKKHDRLEKKMSKEFLEFKLTKELEMAQLNLLAYKTRSKNIKADALEKVKQIQNAINLNFNELKKISDDKRKISKVLASLITE